MSENTNEIVNRSFELAQQFADSYATERNSDKTLDLLENYANERRKLSFEPTEKGLKRPGAAQAYRITQGL